ncbi:MAG TPA: amidase [Terriglobia bacterium]|nr:amidase [Terriglobia bacterium]
MNDQELRQLTLASVAKQISLRELSPVEVTEAVLARIERLNQRMGAFITVTGERALERARAVEREIAGGHKRPLLGIPISIKDLFDTKGIKTTAGSKVFSDRVPEADADVVTMLYEAGAVLVGKTNLHEFAYGVTSINPHYGTARNPWDPQRIAGGSSGGSAAAVALALGFGSLGTDTGGSIRIPASLCGIVGLKPTYGLVSLNGVIPLAPSFDHAGPMAQTVEDVAILLSVITGNRVRYADALTGNIKGIRLGIPQNYFYEHLDPEVDAAVRSAITRLGNLGADIVEVDFSSASLQKDIFVQVATPEAYSYHEQYLQSHGAAYGSDVRTRLEAARTMLSVDYLRAQRARLTMKDECETIFKTTDVIVTPTTAITAPPVDGNVAADLLNRCTRPFNLTGLPTISVPCGFTSGGLPVGLQITGRAFDESTVLRVAHTYEQDAGWFQRRPAA